MKVTKGLTQLQQRMLQDMRQRAKEEAQAELMADYSKPHPCPVCGDYAPGGHRLCRECELCEERAEQLRKTAARRRAFGVGSSREW